MMVSCRVEEEDQLEFLSKLPYGTRSRILREGLKMVIYNLDKSTIARDIKQHQTELDRLESILEWKLESDVNKDNLIDQLMDNPRLGRWLKWYSDKAIKDIVVADGWLDMVLKNIQDDVSPLITKENFLAVVQRKVNKNASLAQFAESEPHA